jgi:hypothetical protein
MKNRKMIATMFASMLMLLMCLTASTSFAQTKKHTAMMKDCCMMKDGKMMCMKKGKMMPMKKDMTMKNGTKCMTNGECVMKNGEKMQMTEGQCMDMKGKMDMCDMMNKNTKSADKKKDMAITYTCPMHPEILRSKPGKCPKCGMKLVVKK